MSATTLLDRKILRHGHEIAAIETPAGWLAASRIGVDEYVVGLYEYGPELARLWDSRAIAEVQTDARGEWERDIDGYHVDDCRRLTDALEALTDEDAALLYQSDEITAGRFAGWTRRDAGVLIAEATNAARVEIDENGAVWISLAGHGVWLNDARVAAIIEAAQ